MIDLETSRRNFVQYEEEVHLLHEQIRAEGSPYHIPGHIKQGEMNVFVLRSHPDAIARLPLPDVHNPGAIMSKETALVRASGHAGLEELLASSVDINPALITRLAPGLELKKVSLEDRDAIPRAHHQQLVQALATLASLGIEEDSDPSNVMYSNESGFTVIDFDLPVQRKAQKQPRAYEYLTQFVRDALNPGITELHKGAPAYFSHFAAACLEVIGTEALDAVKAEIDTLEYAAGWRPPKI